MISFEIGVTAEDLQPKNESVMQEGFISDALSQVANVDTDKVKKDWQDAGTVLGKGQVINDDIINPAADAAEDYTKGMDKTKVDRRSIVARSRDSVLQFPIYVTQTLQVNAAHTIAKMFERVYTTLVQTVLSQNTIMDEDEANGMIFLKKFHTNIKEAADVIENIYYQPIDELDRMMQESVFLRQQLTEDLYVEFKLVPTTDQNLIMESTRLANEPLVGFRYLAEDAGVKVVTKDETTHTKEIFVDDSEIEKIARNKLSDTDARYIDMNRSDIKDRAERQYPNPPHPGKDATDDEMQEWKDKSTDMYQKRQRYIDNENHRIDVAKDHLKDSMRQVKNDIKNGKLDDVGSKMAENDKSVKSRYRYDKATDRIYRIDVSKDEKETKRMEPTPVERGADAPNILKEADIKKINGALPYTVEVSFLLRGKNSIHREVHYVVGIKSVMHLIYAQDLAEDLHELITGNIRSLQKVRYKTGEINFMNYVFNVKGIRADAMKHVNYNKRWINTLKRLAEYEKTNGSFLKSPAKILAGGSIPIPNATLVLSQSDVTTLANQTGIDLSKSSNAIKLAKSLFLISVVIVDSSEGTMRILMPDMSSDWDVQSLASIDAEVAKTDNSQLMRELNKIVNH